jgi:hypothetical protein
LTTPSKILVLDIETKPILAYVWRLFDQNIGLNQVADNGGILCIGAKFVGEKEKYFVSEWTDGHRGMMQGIHDLLSQAEAVVTYNGDKFDLPKINGQFLLLGMPPIGPLTSIDVYKTVRKMGFMSSKLAFVGPYLKIGAKTKHEGFDLWTSVLNGSKPAQKRMTRYCLQDVLLTEKLYLLIRPYMTNHPHMGNTKGTSCPVCSSTKIQSRGYRRTKTFRIQRLQCQDCGSWHDGVRQKI